MLKKIISGGQTGADRAALDFAIKYKIPHGGWVTKGRLAEDGPISPKYKLTEMPTDGYQKRTEQNVIDSDGTLIVSHGKLTGGSEYTRTMAKKHNRPFLHIDLNDIDFFQTSLLLMEWIDQEQIKTLYVTGPSSSQDATIYQGVTEILESILIMRQKMEEISQSPEIKNPPGIKNIKKPDTVDEAIALLMTEMKLKDLKTLANMPKDEIINPHFSVGMWIRSNFAFPGNEKLLQSCREVSGEKYLHWLQVQMVILKELWKRLQETHKLKVVK